jgi:hypothetical protein
MPFFFDLILRMFPAMHPDQSGFPLKGEKSGAAASALECSALNSGRGISDERSAGVMTAKAIRVMWLKRPGFGAEPAKKFVNCCCYGMIGANHQAGRY